MNNLYKKKSAVNGVGLFSKKAYKMGDHVAFIDGPIVVFKKFTPAISKKMLDWIGVGKFSWINTDKSPFRYINHSCDPNVAQVSQRKVIAVKDIPKDTELTLDYSLTEAEPDWSIEPCTCGSKKCRGKVTPIQKLSKTVFNQKKEYVPKRFQRIYTQTNPK